MAVRMPLAPPPPQAGARALPARAAALPALSRDRDRAGHLLRERPAGHAPEGQARLQDDGAARGPQRRRRPDDLRAQPRRHRRRLRRPGRRRSSRPRSASTPCSRPATGEPGDYLLLVGAVTPRKNPLAAALAAQRLGRRLVVAGPDRRRGARGQAARRSAPSCAATSRRRSSSASTAAPRCCSSRPATRASACRRSRRWPAGRPSSARRIRPCASSASAQRSSPPTTSLRARSRRSSPTARSYVRASLARARAYSWQETARRVKDVYLRVIGGRRP